MSKHKNTRKERKAHFAASCAASYRAGVNLGRKKRYIRRMAKINGKGELPAVNPVADVA